MFIECFWLWIFSMECSEIRLHSINRLLSRARNANSEITSPEESFRQFERAKLILCCWCFSFFYNLLSHSQNNLIQIYCGGIECDQIMQHHEIVGFENESDTIHQPLLCIVNRCMAANALWCDAMRCNCCAFVKNLHANVYRSTKWMNNNIIYVKAYISRGVHLSVD